MFDFKIPVGVIPDNITSNLQNMTSLQEAVDNILDLGNKDGGWNISGWTKRGTSADAGDEQSAAMMTDDYAVSLSLRGFK